MSDHHPKNWVFSEYSTCTLFDHNKLGVWISKAPQRSEMWLEHKKGRPSGSNVSVCVGHDTKFKSRQQIAEYISGYKEYVPDSHSKELMEHGMISEVPARKFYISNYNNCTISEIGFVVPGWDLRIGYSPDGIIMNPAWDNLPQNKRTYENILKYADGMMEIKAPLKMYYPINKYLSIPAEKRSADIKSACVISENIPNIYNHIWVSHYDQMQMGMAILNLNWCDYLVYATDSNQTFLQRVVRNSDYWSKTLYPKLICFINDFLNLHIKGTKYPISPNDD